MFLGEDKTEILLFVFREDFLIEVGVLFVDFDINNIKAYGVLYYPSFNF